MSHYKVEAKWPAAGRNYGASGTVHFCGPHREYEGIVGLRIFRIVDGAWVEIDKDAESEVWGLIVDTAESNLEDQAREADEDFQEHNYAWSDDHAEYESYNSGPDYWVDRESGEWRCG